MAAALGSPLRYWDSAVATRPLLTASWSVGILGDRGGVLSREVDERVEDRQRLGKVAGDPGVVAAVDLRREVGRQRPGADRGARLPDVEGTSDVVVVVLAPGELVEDGRQEAVGVGQALARVRLDDDVGGRRVDGPGAGGCCGGAQRHGHREPHDARPHGGRRYHARHIERRVRRLLGNRWEPKRPTAGALDGSACRPNRKSTATRRSAADRRRHHSCRASRSYPGRH